MSIDECRIKVCCLSYPCIIPDDIHSVIFACFRFGCQPDHWPKKELNERPTSNIQLPTSNNEYYQSKIRNPLSS